MKKTDKQSGGKQPMLVSLLVAILLLVGGYLGIPLIDEQGANEYSQNQEIREDFSGQDEVGNAEKHKDKDSEEQTGKESLSDEVIKYNFRSDKLWQEHYEKHGIEMGFDDPEDYLLAANKVIENKDALHKLEAEDGDDVYYLEETNEFVIVSTDGYLRTYFNPDSGIAYFNRQ